MEKYAKSFPEDSVLDKDVALQLAEQRMLKQANAITEMRERILFLKIKEKKLAKAITRKHEWALRLRKQLLREGLEPVAEREKPK